MKRSLVITLAVQALIVGLVAVPRLSVRLTGTEYRLRVQPVDPIDPFRGAYVDLEYAGFQGDGMNELDGRAYVPLRRDGDAWVGTTATTTRPESGPYVTCDSDGWRLGCGIESWFVSQDRAKRVERELVDGGIARVRISDSGRAVLVRVED